MSAEQTPEQQAGIKLVAVYQFLEWMRRISEENKFPTDLSARITSSARELRKIINQRGFERLDNDEITVRIPAELRKELAYIWNSLEFFEKGQYNNQLNPFRPQPVARVYTNKPRLVRATTA